MVGPRAVEEAWVGWKTLLPMFVVWMGSRAPFLVSMSHLTPTYRASNNMQTREEKKREEEKGHAEEFGL
jgi:hypothetical protein